MAEDFNRWMSTHFLGFKYVATKKHESLFTFDFKHLPLTRPMSVCNMLCIHDSLFVLIKWNQFASWKTIVISNVQAFLLIEHSLGPSFF